MIPTQIRFYYIFNILLQRNVTPFSKNPPIHQTRQNDVLRDNMNTDVSFKSVNYAINGKPDFSVSIFYTCEKATKQKEPLRCVP